MKRFAIAAMLLSAACARKEGAPADEHVPSAVTASVETAGSVTFDEIVDAVGVVVARPGHVAVLAAPAATRVAKVFVAAGAMVKVGDPLIEFEQAPFEAAAQSAEAALAAAERTLARATRLAEVGVLPRKEADVAASELAAARSAALMARRARELSILHAPIAGAVTRISAMLGASVDPSVPLVEVTDSRALDVVLTVSPTDAARIRPGQTVTLFAGTSASEAALGGGQVADVAAMVDSASGGVAIRVTMATPTRPVRVAEPMFGRIGVAKHANAVVVPLEALVPTGEGFQVFIVDAAGVAHATPVTIGGRSDKMAWITDGLKAGDRVVTRGAYGINDSSKVLTGKP